MDTLLHGSRPRQPLSDLRDQEVEAIRGSRLAAGGSALPHLHRQLRVVMRPVEAERRHTVVDEDAVERVPGDVLVGKFVEDVVAADRQPELRREIVAEVQIGDPLGAEGLVSVRPVCWISSAGMTSIGTGNWITVRSERRVPMTMISSVKRLSWSRATDRVSASPPARSTSSVWAT